MFVVQRNNYSSLYNAENGNLLFLTNIESALFLIIIFFNFNVASAVGIVSFQDFALFNNLTTDI